MTKDEAIFLLSAFGVGALASLLRTWYERNKVSFWRRCLIVVMGGVVGTGAGAIGIGFGVHSLIAIAGAALVGSAGEMLLAGLWRAGREFERDPIGTAGKVADVARGEKTDGGGA